jgi:hypothetical protein
VGACLSAGIQGGRARDRDKDLLDVAEEVSGLTITDPRGLSNLVKKRQKNQLIAVGAGSEEKTPFPSRSWQDTYDMLLGCGRSSNLFRRLESQCPAPSSLRQSVAPLPV